MIFPLASITDGFGTALLLAGVIVDASAFVACAHGFWRRRFVSGVPLVTLLFYFLAFRLSDRPAGLSASGAVIATLVAGHVVCQVVIPILSGLRCPPARDA